VAHTKPQQNDVYEQAALEFELEIYGVGHELYPESRRVLDGLAVACCVAGLTDRAHEYMKLLVERYPDESRFHYNLACTFCTKGKHDDALIALDNAVTRGFADFIYMTNDEDLIALRDHPKFIEYFKKALTQRSGGSTNKE
jgi:tetratricopeptide (TPR) repeat protein